MFIKRDDALIPSFGGNKVRKLEFMVGDALAKGSDSLVTSGHIQSNHARLTAMVARRLGLDVALVLYTEEGDRMEEEKRNGNLLLDLVLGARVRYVQGYDAIDEGVSKAMLELKQGGHRPYLIPTAGYAPLGALGYVECFLELDAQAAEMGIKPSHVLVASGSGGTQAGLVLGNALLARKTQIIGISDAPKNQVTRNVLDLAERTGELLFANGRENQDAVVDPSEVVVYDEVSGKSVASLKDEVSETVRLVAKKEGIFLDPSYTARAMYGLIQLIRTSDFKKDDTVVFLHSGGVPMMFSQRLEANLKLTERG